MERDYYGAVIRAFQFGPRRELTLDVDTFPRRNTATDRTGIERIRIRLGGIANYEEVVQAFSGLNTHESLHYLRDAPASKTTRRLIELEFDRTEQRTLIIAQHVQEQAAPQSVPQSNETDAT